MTYDVQLLPKQQEYIEIPHDYPIDVALYQGGFGSGKTFIGSLLGILLCIKYPGVKGLVGAQTYKMVRDTTMESYFEHLEALGCRYKYNKTDDKITFTNGSTIIFRHLEEPDKLKSLNLGFIEIEEMSEIPEATFDMLLSRLRQKPKSDWVNFRHRLFGHTNPQDGKGWIYERFVEKKYPNIGYRRILASTMENKHLPNGYIDLLKASFNEDYFNRNVLGLDDDVSSKLLIKNFKPEIQVTDSITINDFYPIHVTCDFNANPMCWYIAQDYDNNMYVLDELVQLNTTTDASAGVLADVLRDYKNREIIINGDASGSYQTTKASDYQILLNRLRLEGFKNVNVRVMNKNPGIETRITCFNNFFYGVDKKHHFFMTSKCKWLRYNFENLETEPGTGKPKKISTGKLRTDSKAMYLGHPIDAVSYMVYLYHPIRDLSFNKVQRSSDGIDIYEGKYNGKAGPSPDEFDFWETSNKVKE